MNESTSHFGPHPQYNQLGGYHHESLSLSRSDRFDKNNKRLRKTVRQVPWRDELELQIVGKGLLSVLQDCDESDTGNGQQNLENGNHEPSTVIMSPHEAFEMISVWKARLTALGGLPHAIESTSTLAQIYWKDSQRRKQRVFSSFIIMDLRLAYAAAILRCVNGFADSMQQNRAFKASVSDLCARLEIPSWVVDIRHDSTHNALPSIEILRDSAMVLLEYMRSKFWIPYCDKWNNQIMESTAPTEKDLMINNGKDKNNRKNDNREGVEQRTRKKGINKTPLDLLRAYTTCAFAWASSRSVNTVSNSEDTTKCLDSKATGIERKNRKTTILPYDPLFGEVGINSGDRIVEDEESGNEDDNFNFSIWGTNTNRFALLEIPKKKRKKKQKKKIVRKELVQNTPKKRKGEKTPNDYAKLFVTSVSSPQEAYATASRYLIWGGIGESFVGQGVLMPDLESKIPTTLKGVSMCWELYTPLIDVICRTFPGFAVYMIINLVRCVLFIENDAVHQVNHHLDADSQRKLYFLSAWVHLLLSQRFVTAMDRNFSMIGSIKKKISQKGETKSFDLPLANLTVLQYLGYPLNSLLDQCIQHHRNRRSNANNDNDGTVSSSIFDLMTTSRGIIDSLEKIIGTNKAENFGYSNGYGEANALKQKNINLNIDQAKTTDKVKQGALSLDEIELLLSNSHASRPTWIKCKTWDACSIGSFPGNDFIF